MIIRPDGLIGTGGAIEGALVQHYLETVLIL